MDQVLIVYKYGQVNIRFVCKIFPVISFFDCEQFCGYRRKAFWVAKQVLQLGMGDAFDDWLIEKIHRLRRGSVVASGIRRLEQVSWNFKPTHFDHISRLPN